MGVADQPERGALDRQAGCRVRCADVLVHGVARAAVPALHVAAARRGLARTHPLRRRRPLSRSRASSIDRTARRPRLAEPRGLGRSRGAVVVVAHQRHGATLARASHHMLGVRAPAGHVPQRPQLLHTTRLGRADHGVKRLRVRVRVAEHRYDHHPNPRPPRTRPGRVRRQRRAPRVGVADATWNGCALRARELEWRRSYAQRRADTRNGVPADGAVVSNGVSNRPGIPDG